MRTVQAEVEVRTAPERIIAAFLELDALRSWWHVERALVEPGVGGVYALAWGITPHGFQYLTTGIVSALDPARLLRIECYTYFHPERSILGPMTLLVEAQPQADGRALMRITQDGYQMGGDWDWYYDAVRQAWPQVARDVARYLEQRQLEI
jgi:uncharacterized protein YndB with AHSA1/START domain